MDTSTTKPRLRIRDATEADVPAIARIHFDAFGPGIMSRLMYPRGFGALDDGDPSSSAIAKFAESVLAPLEQPASRSSSRPLPAERVVMVAEEVFPDDEGEEGEGKEKEKVGEIIAFAKWKIVKEPLTAEEWDVEIKDKTVEEMGPWVDVDVYNAFIGGLNRTMKGFQKGEPLVYLNILACKTSRHRSGAGTALLRWGTDKADREGKVAYLEASPAGYPLYRRLGFEDMHVQDLCVTERWGAARGPGEDWGGDGAVALAGPAPEGVFRTVFMRRVPRGG